MLEKESVIVVKFIIELLSLDNCFARCKSIINFVTEFSHSLGQTNQTNIGLIQNVNTNLFYLKNIFYCFKTKFIKPTVIRMRIVTVYITATNPSSS